MIEGLTVEDWGILALDAFVALLCLWKLNRTDTRTCIYFRIGYLAILIGAALNFLYYFPKPPAPEGLQLRTAAHISAFIGMALLLLFDRRSRAKEVCCVQQDKQ